MDEDLNTDRINTVGQQQIAGNNRLFGIALFLLFIVLSFLSTNSFGQTYTIDMGGTITTCSGTIYDSGGSGGGPPGRYSNNEDYTITICSDNGEAVVLTFTDFGRRGWLRLPLYI